MVRCSYRSDKQSSEGRSSVHRSTAGNSNSSSIYKGLLFNLYIHHRLVCVQKVGPNNFFSGGGRGGLYVPYILGLPLTFNTEGEEVC